MNKKHCPAAILALLLLGGGIGIPPVCAEPAPPELFWLADTPPRSVEAAVSNASGTPAPTNVDEADSLSSSAKRLWFRQGRALGEAAFMGEEALSLRPEILDVAGRRTVAVPEKAGKAALIRVEIKEPGFNTVYARLDQRRGRTLWVRLAKAELLRATLRARDVAPEQRQTLRDATQPLEIVREPLEKEINYARMVSGDTLTFTLFAHGVPLAGTPITLLTQQGWQKSVLTDAQGQARFTLIRDYFPDWKDFRRRTREMFVVIAEHETQQTDAFAGEPHESYASIHYQATLSGRYALSPNDYKSYAYGLGVVGFTTVFSGLAVYLYRRRRVRPLREIRFSERE